MCRRKLLPLTAGAMMAFATAASAQVNCETFPAGPQRTDCYLTQSRIGAGNAAIAGSKARVSTDAATLGAITGTPVKPKPRRKKTPRPPR